MDRTRLSGPDPGDYIASVACEYDKIGEAAIKWIAEQDPEAKIFFCAVASIVFVARIDSITSNAGTNYETNALAAAIIGGVTFDGGKGTISGAFLGCLLMGVISNAMNILGVDNNVQTIITGAIIVAAVVLSNINNIKKK